MIVYFWRFQRHSPILGITPSRQARHFDFNALVQSLNPHIPYHLFHSCHLLYSMYQYPYLPTVGEVI